MQNQVEQSQDVSLQKVTIKACKFSKGNLLIKDGKNK